MKNKIILGGIVALFIVSRNKESNSPPSKIVYADIIDPAQPPLVPTDPPGGNPANVPITGIYNTHWRNNL